MIGIVGNETLGEGTVCLIIEREVIVGDAFRDQAVETETVHFFGTVLYFSVLLGAFAKIFGTAGGTAPSVVLEEARDGFAVGLDEVRRFTTVRKDGRVDFGCEQ